MVFITFGCDSIVDQKTEADTGITNSEMAGDFSVEEGSVIECIDPTVLAYNIVTDSKTVKWGNPRNPFEKKVDIEYYNTLTEFVIRVKRTHAIADVLVDDESIKDFDGTVPAGDDWQEFTFELDEGWKAGDAWAFVVKVTGSGPAAEFEVSYGLVGECVFYTLSLAVNPEGAGTVTGGDEYKKGDEAAIVASANEGWAFVNWTDGADSEISTLASFNYTIPDNDVTLTANFEAVYYTLSLAVNPEGAGTVTGGDEYKKGDVAELEATANEGWAFVNWTDGADAEISTSASFNYTMPDNDVTLTANYITWLRDTQTAVVDVVSTVTGKTWMDRNLGATRVATSSTDAQAYGDLYQWGRAADGHQKRSSATTNTLSSSNQPDHGDFILTDINPYDWRAPQNDGLWQGVNGINNPCPVGYRLPTSAEWEAERLSWSSNNAAGAFDSTLKLPVPGRRIGTNGWLLFEGSGGFYWSDTVNDTEALYLFFDGSTSREISYRRARGLSVRCIKE